MAELKNCPFCGSEKITEVHSMFPCQGECQNCGATAAKWQSRPIESALESALTAEQEENKRLQSTITAQAETIKALKNPWIKVSERLPEFEIDVLVCDENGNTDHGYFNGFSWVSNTMRDYDGDKDYINATHWMPLPEPPKEGE